MAGQVDTRDRIYLSVGKAISSWNSIEVMLAFAMEDYKCADPLLNGLSSPMKMMDKKTLGEYRGVTTGSRARMMALRVRVKERQKSIPEDHQAKAYRQLIRVLLLLIDVRDGLAHGTMMNLANGEKLPWWNGTIKTVWDITEARFEEKDVAALSRVFEVLHKVCVAIYSRRTEDGSIEKHLGSLRARFNAHKDSDDSVNLVIAEASNQETVKILNQLEIAAKNALKST